MKRMWIVQAGEEDGTTCIVAARTTFSETLELLEWPKTLDGDYQGKTKAKGEAKAAVPWWAGFMNLARRHDIDVLAGDFNMAL